MPCASGRPPIRYFRGSQIGPTRSLRARPPPACRRRVGPGGASVLVAASSAAAHGPGVAHPWQSIQKAIDRAKPGDKIIVKPGTYRENLEIATDGIKLVGFGATLKPPAQARPGFCDDEPGVVTGICVHGEFDEEFNPLRLVRDVEIKGLKVDGFSSSGVFAAGTAGFRAVLAGPRRGAPARQRLPDRARDRPWRHRLGLPVRPRRQRCRATTTARARTGTTPTGARSSRPTASTTASYCPREV
jgi:hypothetical protein